MFMLHRSRQTKVSGLLPCLWLAYIKLHFGMWRLCWDCTLNMMIETLLLILLLLLLSPSLLLLNNISVCSKVIKSLYFRNSFLSILFPKLASVVQILSIEGSVLLYMRSDMHIQQQLEVLKTLYICGPSPLSAFKLDLAENLANGSSVNELDAAELQLSLEECLGDSNAVRILPEVALMTGQTSHIPFSLFQANMIMAWIWHDFIVLRKQ